MVAATVVASRVERLVLPLRDAFAAVFFFVFGLSLDPGDAAGVAWLVAIAVALSFVLNTIAGVVARAWSVKVPTPRASPSRSSLAASSR